MAPKKPQAEAPNLDSIFDQAITEGDPPNLLDNEPDTDSDTDETTEGDVSTIAPDDADVAGAHDDQPAATDAARVQAEIDEAEAEAPPMRINFDQKPDALNWDQPAGVDNTPIDVETGERVTSGYFLDLTSGTELELIPTGTRVIISCTAAEAVISGNGNPMINLRVKVERVVMLPPKIDPNKAPSMRNRTVRDRLMFIPPNDVTGSRGTLWRAKQAYNAFGVDWPKLQFRSQAEAMQRFASDAEAFIGAVAEAVIGVDDGTDGGKKKAQINPETNEPYPPKNTIATYYAYKPSMIVKDEDLPF